MTLLVDSNVLLDVFTEDPLWFSWSSEQLASHAERDTLAINPLVYAEVSLRFGSLAEVEAALPREIRRLDLPWEAAFLAGQRYLSYKQRGGAKLRPMPDFYIGAHASSSGFALISRDAAFFRTYFPEVHLVCPET